MGRHSSREDRQPFTQLENIGCLCPGPEVTLQHAGIVAAAVTRGRAEKGNGVLESAVRS